MKLFLASFMQKENFGKGNIIGITTGSKPRDIVVKERYLPLTPPQDLLDEYYKMLEIDPKQAGENFTNRYTAQCEKFVTDILEVAAKDGKTAIEILPFEDGDTLCSWERSQYTNYRKILAPFLEKLGFEVILN